MTHYEIYDGPALLRIGKCTMLAISVLHFTSERDARSVARETGRKLFRVEGGKRTEIEVRRKRT